MSVFDEQNKKFGKICKWLECDCDCHMTTCILNWARREILQDRFKELKLKHPDFVYGIYSEDCLGNCEGSYDCFDGNEKPKSNSIEELESEDFTYTNLEKEALEIAKAEFKDEELVKQLYKEGKNKCILRLEKRLENMKSEITDLKNEVE